MDKMKTYKTVEELTEGIRTTFPHMPGAGQNLLRYDLLLRAQGSSLEKVLDTMRVEGSPFLKLSSRD